MNYRINIKYLTKKMPMEKAAGFVAKAGFNALDYTPACSRDGWEEELHRDMNIFQKEKLYVHQTHAPFNRYANYDQNFMKYVERTLEATSIMGAEYMVVHGDEFDFENAEYSPQAALSYNYELFAPIVDKATALGINIAFENVFEDWHRQRPRFCSNAEDLKALIEKFNTKNVCCCWDFGHAGVSFSENQPQKILELGKYIKCTHVHDCGHGKDLHLPPLLGDNDWTACMKALKEIDYKGNITFEMVYGEIPEEMGEMFAGYMKGIADYLNGI